MFSLRRETDYAIQFLKTLYRAKANAVLSLNEISKTTKISFLFLQKIARKLRLAGIIEAYQGVEGGYRLKAGYRKISLKKIIETTQGKCCILACESENKSSKCCQREIAGNGDKKLKAVNKKILKILEQTKLSQI